MFSPLARLRSLLAALLVAVGACTFTGTAAAGIANAGLRGASASNPLAGMGWGIYTGTTDGVYPAYQQASGTDRVMLAKIARRPLMFWFGNWFSTAEAKIQAQDAIAQTTHGNPNLLTQMAVFRLTPWEGQACTGTWDSADQAAYHAWIDAFASGIGDARVAIVLQPDLPFALCTRSPVPLALVSYAAQTLSTLAHTTVYIDTGAGDWPTVANSVSLLERAGVRYVRGFALNATHYDSTANEVIYGAQVASALARAGIHNVHFVVNTAENGRPFQYHVYARHLPNPDNARVCTSAHEPLCETLGIPPTTNVASPRWGLSRHVRALARRYADAYLWFGRPWLDNQAWPFDLNRAIALGASTPY